MATGTHGMGHGIFVLSVLFFLSAQIFLPVGITLMTYLHSDVDDMNNVRHIATVLSALYTTTGTLLLLISVSGCVATLSKGGLITKLYAILASIVIITEVSVAIVMLQSSTDILELARTMSVKLLRDKILNYTGDEDTGSTADIDGLQKRSECCGASTYMDFQDYAKKWDMRNQHVVPSSCCVMVETRTGLKTKLTLLQETCPRRPTPYNSYIEHPCVTNQTIRFISFLTLGLTFVLVAMKLLALSLAVCHIWKNKVQERKKACQITVDPIIKVKVGEEIHLP